MENRTRRSEGGHVLCRPRASEGKVQRLKHQACYNQGSLRPPGTEKGTGTWQRLAVNSCRANANYGTGCTCCDLHVSLRRFTQKALLGRAQEHRRIWSTVRPGLPRKKRRGGPEPNTFPQKIPGGYLCHRYDTGTSGFSRISRFKTHPGI